MEANSLAATLKELKSRMVDQLTRRDYMPTDPSECLMRLVEEVGELAKAEREEMDLSEIAMESADILWQLLRYCHLKEIDLEASFLGKLAFNETRPRVMTEKRLGAIRWQLESYIRRRLPAYIFYHSPQHSVEEVFTTAEALCDLEKIRGERRMAVLTAALFHDVGYVRRYYDNEDWAARFSVRLLSAWGFSDSFTKLVSKLIMATKIPQSPSSLLEQIICDADLDSLGREDFLHTSSMLYKERLMMGERLSVDEWIDMQISFLSNHQYFTASQSQRRDEQKKRNIAALRSKGEDVMQYYTEAKKSVTL